MREQPFDGKTNAAKINIPPEYLEKINLQIKDAIKAAEGLIDETRESVNAKGKAVAALKNFEFIEWATNHGYKLFANLDETSDNVKNKLAEEIASKALMWPEQIVH